MKKLTAIGIMTLALLAGCQAEPQNQIQENLKPETENTQKVETIQVDTPIAHQFVTSPIEITGQVRGNWMFEAIFDVELQAPDGTLLARSPAYATEDWMTEDFVPFQATVVFDPPGIEEGKLIFKQASPAGPEGNEPQFFEIPVRFVEE